MSSLLRRRAAAQEANQHQHRPPDLQKVTLDDSPEESEEELAPSKPMILLQLKVPPKPQPVKKSKLNITSETPEEYRQLEYPELHIGELLTKYAIDQDLWGRFNKALTKVMGGDKKFCQITLNRPASKESFITRLQTHLGAELSAEDIEELNKAGNGGVCAWMIYLAARIERERLHGQWMADRPPKPSAQSPAGRNMSTPTPRPQRGDVQSGIPAGSAPPRPPTRAVVGQKRRLSGVESPPPPAISTPAPQSAPPLQRTQHRSHMLTPTYESDGSKSVDKMQVRKQWK